MYTKTTSHRKDALGSVEIGSAKRISLALASKDLRYHQNLIKLVASIVRIVLKLAFIGNLLQIYFKFLSILYMAEK